MGDVIILPVIRVERGGGKARIKCCCVARNLAEPFIAEDLRMDHADRWTPRLASCAGSQVIVRDDCH